MPIYNFVEYSQSYSKTSGSLWNYDREKPNSSIVGEYKVLLKEFKVFDDKLGTPGKLKGTNTTKTLKLLGH